MGTAATARNLRSFPSLCPMAWFALASLMPAGLSQAEVQGLKSQQSAVSSLLFRLGLAHHSSQGGSHGFHWVSA